MLTIHCGKLALVKTALQERMEEVQERTGLAVSEIAKICGVSSSAVSQWLGKGKKPSLEIASVRAAVRLEEATGYKALWLACGEGAKMREDFKGLVQTTPPPAQLVPQSIGTRLLAQQLVLKLEPINEAAREMASVALKNIALRPETAEQMIEQLVVLLGEMDDQGRSRNRLSR